MASMDFYYAYDGQGRLEGGLRVVLAGWLGGDQNWKGYFPEFRRAGGKLRKTIHDPDYWNPEKAMRSWEGYPVPRLETE